MPIVVVVVGQGGDLLLLIITNVSSYSTAYVWTLCRKTGKNHFLLCNDKTSYSRPAAGVATSFLIIVNKSDFHE